MNIPAACFCLLIGASSALKADPSPNPNSDTGADVPTRLNEADRHHRAGAYHLEAEALEQALELLEPGDPLRTVTARRLINLYRGGLGRFERAADWVRTIADELRPSPEGIDALFELADTEFNHGRIDPALATYKEILRRIMAPSPPWDRFDQRCWPAWHGEQLCRYPKGSDPLFPSNVTVTSQLGHFIQLVQERNWLEAGLLLDRNPALHAALELKRDPKTWTSAHRWLANTIRGLPDESLHALEAYYRPSLREIKDKSDWPALREYRFQHPIPSLEMDLDAAIGDKLLKTGMPALASLHYRLALADDPENASPILLAKEIFARTVAGGTATSIAIPKREVELAGERHSLQHWAEVWQEKSLRTRKPSPPLDVTNAKTSPLPLFQAPLPLGEWQIRWYTREHVEWPPFAEEFIPCIPVGSERSLIVSLGTAVEAIDVVDGRSLWTFLAPEENSMAYPNQHWRTRRVIVECARSGTAAVERDRVFCNLVWGHHNTTRHAGVIVALCRKSGAMLWSTANIPELAGMQMAGEPAVDRGVVVSLAWSPQEAIPTFQTVGIAAESGRLLWSNHLFSGNCLTVRNNEDFLYRPLACGQPAIVDHVAYLNTGAGVIAAVKVVDGSLVWALQYPRLKAINVSDWAARMITSRPAGIVAVFEDVALFAPTDSHCLIAVDRETGEVRYLEEDLDLRAIAAADEERAYLLRGTSIRAINPGNRDTIWEETLPVSGVVDLPTLSDRGLWCPAWEGLFLLDPSTGDLLASRPWQREQACGFVRDFGDRLVGASRVGLNVLAQHQSKVGDAHALSPEKPVAAVGAEVPSRDNKWLRWSMPCQNRGDFFLSRADPEHMIMRSEILQKRKIDPIPSLCWERPSPLPWNYDVTFDRRYIAVWNEARLFVLDATSGDTLWHDVLPVHLKPTDGWGAALYEGALLWWGAKQIHCYTVENGEERWLARPGGTILGVRPTTEGVGVYLKGQGHTALLLDRRTGEEKARIPIPSISPVPYPPPPPGKHPPQLANLPSMIVGRNGPGRDAPVADVVFVDSAAPVRIDWKNGKAIPGEPVYRPRRGEGFEAHLIVFDRYVVLRGRDTDSNVYHHPIIAAWDRETLVRVETPREVERWSISGDFLFSFCEHRLTCTNLKTGSQLWRSFTVKDRCHLVMPSDDFVLLLTRDERWGQDDIRDVSYLRLFDVKTGEQTKVCSLPKRWMHTLDLQPDRLFLWDIAYVHHLRPPDSDLDDNSRTIRIPDITADPDAVAALRVARDIEDPPRIEILDLSVPPRVDGNFCDWPDTVTRRLESVMDWKPDFAHRSRTKSRYYGGESDISATVRVGRAGDSFYLAVEVTDDRHVSDPKPGLWRSDSITLHSARPGGHDVEPTFFTVALAGGVPRFELGTAVSAAAVSDPPEYDPALAPGPRTFVLSPLSRTGSTTIVPGTPVEVAIHRDETAKKTLYELKVPRTVWPIDEDVYWDLIINENDGEGREGAVQFASSVWGIEETAVGSMRGAE